MKDMATSAEQMNELRVKLSELREQTVAERTRITQFLTKLMLACRGHDRELDTRLAKLKQRIDVNHTYMTLDAEMVLIERLLQRHSDAVQDSIDSVRDAVHFGAKNIRPVRDFTEKACQTLREHLLADDGYSFGDYHRKVLKLLEYYQQALKYQSAQSPCFKKTRTSPSPTRSWSPARQANWPTNCNDSSQSSTSPARLANSWTASAASCCKGFPWKTWPIWPCRSLS
nr:hypothetical protein [Aeromonas schubertii]